MKKAKIIVLEKATLKMREPNFCGALCKIVCGGFYIVPD
jgi:hypothetical protein